MKSLNPILENTAIYQINLRAFTNEGTLEAASKLLPHIRDCGFGIVYICPCFAADESAEGWSPRQIKSGIPNPKNPYRMSDYYNIDPEYGTNDDLKLFVEEAHRNGLRVLLDLVYFHCGPAAVFLNDHPDFIVRNADGTPALGEWCFPRLNFECPELRRYLEENMLMYVRDCGVDGFRCDVGDEVPLDFWAHSVAAIRAINKDVIMLNEGVRPDALDVFDINYCWSFRVALRGVMESGKPVSTLIDSIREFSNKHLQGSARSITFLDTHDTSSDDYDNRLEKRIGFEAMNAAFVFHYTLPNVPFVYCGTEVADTRRHSIWGSRFYAGNFNIDWQNLATQHGQARIELLRLLSNMRHSYPALAVSAPIKFVDSGNDGVIAFFRGDATSTEPLLVVVNLRNEPAKVSLADCALSSQPETLLSSGDNASVRIFRRTGKVCCTLGGYGYVVVAL